VLPRGVDVRVLRVLGNVLKRNTGLLGLGCSAMSGMHIPNSTGHTGCVCNISI
jgi:hypothetical protein